MIKLIALLFFAAIFPVEVLMAQLDRKLVVSNQTVESTFMAPKNINLYTIEPLSKGELHYSIMHTFGEVNSGVSNLWGIDQGANVRFSFEYGLSNALSVGIGRSSLDKVYDLTSRVALLKQKSTDRNSLSISLIPSIGITTASFTFLQDDYSLSDRLNFSLSLPMGYKLNESLSLQLTPIFASFNRVGPELNIADPSVNQYYSIAASGRYKIRPRTAITFQHVPPITNADNLTSNLAIGIDIETGGHVFQMFFTTSNALNESYLISNVNGNLFDGGYRFGFNVNRLFALGNRN